MEYEFVFANLDMIAGPKNHRDRRARVVDESPISAAAISYVEKALLGTLQHRVMARDAVII
jgi:hypothetical protein